MRHIFLPSALLAALAISVTAHATPSPTQDFSFSLDGGSAVTFTLDPTDFASHISGLAVTYHPVTFSDGTTGNYVEFAEPTAEGLHGVGLADFAIVNFVLSQELFTGPQLYTGSESDPHFTPGTYTLTGDPLGGTADTETLSLTIGPAPVPEPSSMVLFGTGVLGCAGAVRRRVLRA